MRTIIHSLFFIACVLSASNLWAVQTDCRAQESAVRSATALLNRALNNQQSADFRLYRVQEDNARRLNSFNDQLINYQERVETLKDQRSVTIEEIEDRYWFCIGDCPGENRAKANYDRQIVQAQNRYNAHLAKLPGLQSQLTMKEQRAVRNLDMANRALESAFRLYEMAIAALIRCQGAIQTTP